LVLIGLTAGAEQRFPPPEFESGHQLPVTAVPAARAVMLQYLDIAVLAGSLGLASWLVYKKRSRRGVMALSMFSVLYFGFWRKGCVCSIGSLQNVALALFDPSYALPIGVTAFFVLPLAFAVFSGRTFCAGVCPHGALQDLVLVKPLKVPAWLENGLGILPYIYLGAAVLFAATGSQFIVCQYDPIVPIFRMGGRWLMVGAGVAILLTAMFVGRPYCRFFCPYGSLLKLAGTVSKWRVRVTPDFCTQCRLCEASCPFGAMREPETGRANPKSAMWERRRLGWLIWGLPLLVAAGGWLGWRFSGAASRVHPAVQLAELYVREHDAPVKSGPLAPEDYALDRARQSPEEVLGAAARVQKRFAVGGALFGGWLGLVIGGKMISLSIRRRRTDYEPDRGSCYACARCFEYCPNELIRRGVIPASLGPELGVAKVAGEVANA
jgi:ferredoxin